MSAAAVQPVALQPLALAEPGTDVSAAAEEQPHPKYPSVQLRHAGALGVSALPFSPRLSLADLCSSQRGDAADGGEDADEELAAEFSEERLWLKACACFIRTRYLDLTDVYEAVVSGRHVLFFPSVRLLLRILQQQQSSFVLQRSENALKSTDEELQRLSPEESTLQALTEVRTRPLGLCWDTSAAAVSPRLCLPKVMSEDLIPEKMREDNQDGESLSSICVQSFRERWWNKVLLRGVHETDGQSTLNTVGR